MSSNTVADRTEKVETCRTNFRTLPCIVIILNKSQNVMPTSIWDQDYFIKVAASGPHSRSDQGSMCTDFQNSQSLSKIRIYVKQTRGWWRWHAILSKRDYIRPLFPMNSRNNRSFCSDYSKTVTELLIEDVQRAITRISKTAEMENGWSPGCESL